ncbi:MAG: M48 family metalloprotease [Patescibacteria group bacterium]
MRNRESFLKHAVIGLLLPLMVFLPVYAETAGQISAPIQTQTREDPKPLPQDHVLAIIDGLDPDVRALLVLPARTLFETASSLPEETRAKLADVEIKLKKTIEDVELKHKTEMKRMESERELLSNELDRLTKAPAPTAETAAKERERLGKEISKREKSLADTEKKLAVVGAKIATENREKEREKLLDERQKLSSKKAGLENENNLLKSQIDSLSVSSADWNQTRREKQHLMRCRIQSLDATLAVEGTTYIQKEMAYAFAAMKLKLLTNWLGDEKTLLAAIANNTVSTILNYSDFENIGFRTLQNPKCKPGKKCKSWKSDEKGQRQDLKKGEEIYKILMDRGKIKPPVDDPVVQNYIQDLRDALVQNSDIKPGNDIKVVVVNDDAINAFAFPGYFFINKGLLLALENESQLFGVMAHELAHIAARHVYRGEKAANKRGKILQIAQTVLYFLAMYVGIPLWVFYAAYYGLQLGTVYLIAQLLHISRDFEAEADLLGAQYTFRAGYDPRAFIDTFDLIARISRRDPMAQPWYVGHPSHYIRMYAGYSEWLYLNSVNPAKAANLKTDSTRFHEVQDRLRAWNEKFKQEHPEEYRPTLNPRKQKEEGCPADQTIKDIPVIPEPKTTTPEIQYIN